MQFSVNEYLFKQTTLVFKENPDIPEHFNNLLFSISDSFVVIETQDQVFCFAVSDILRISIVKFVLDDEIKIKMGWIGNAYKRLAPEPIEIKPEGLEIPK